MAGSFGDYLEAALLNHVFGGPDYVRPGTVYVALFTVAPGEGGGGTEPAGGSYARVAVTNNATNFPTIAAGGIKTNGTGFVWPEATGDWGSVVAVGVLDAAAVGTGNMMGYDDTITPQSVLTGDTARIPAGDLEITLA